MHPTFPAVYLGQAVPGLAERVKGEVRPRILMRSPLPLRKKSTSHVGCGCPRMVPGKACGTGRQYAQVDRACSEPVAASISRGFVRVDYAAASMVEAVAFADAAVDNTAVADTAAADSAGTAGYCV